ncbi:hypothetical protein M413DRAFT_25411 [Hebeloma cylindrosporum]|uniref:G domain-containing protein n=1 Tax=Hebeloma cylindrosporum TaxID=76867 RepID=A0A0C2YS79_HEBCY|nr:hypothetical protein M413DRAFT_25411 [Hebeloma cylindrosporum h7]
MQNTNTLLNRTAIIALMGPTGTGKSTFINLLTNDDKIRIGHDLESQTFDITTSHYVQDGVSVTLVDTPGFDDSREGITDTDILGKIADFLQEGGERKLNGVIYLHRISDPRMGGAAKKNLRVFKEVCGDMNLGHVRIVTTYWNLVDEKQGNSRQIALAQGAFKSLIDGGADLCRHDKGLESARSIISQLIHQEPVTMKIQEELNEGRALGDTSAGAVIIEEMKELKRKHDKEVEGLKRELEEAAMANDEQLRAELAEEHRKLEERMARAEKDGKTLGKTRFKSGAGAPNAREQIANDLYHMRSGKQAEMKANVYAAPISSAPLPPQRNYLPHEQSNDTADYRPSFQEVLHEMMGVIIGYSEAGGEHLGSFGVVAGGVVGVCLSPFIVVKRAIARQ